MQKKISKMVAIFLTISIFLNCQYVYAGVVINPIEYIKSEFSKEIRLEDDYYTAINKDWLDSIELDEGKMSYGTFEELSCNVADDIKNIICNIRSNKDKYSKDSDEIKVLNLFENYLDMDSRNELGIQPIKKYIDKVNSVETMDQLMDILSNYDFLYFQSLINLGVGIDFRDSSKNVLYISRIGLGLGNPGYYKFDSKDNKKIRKEYIKYIEKLHKLSGKSSKDAKSAAKSFYDFENTIAQVTPAVDEEAADPKKVEKSYNVYTMDAIRRKLSNVDIDKILNNLNIDVTNKIIVEDPNQLAVINELICEDNIDILKNFIITSILINSDTVLNKDFREASDGLKKSLYGASCENINEMECVKFVDYELGGIISRLYVEKYFDKECKEEVEEIADEIIENFQGRLEKLSWMSEDTKIEAINKLNKVKVKIGYPNKWKDYSNLSIRSYAEGGDLIENTINIFKLEAEKQFAKLNKDVDKDEWNMEAFVVNAYYNPINNEIVFPAGILQKPFYDHQASKECNLGGIGTVIGHELTHAFDNTGAQFDEEGNLKLWWRPKDYEEFIKRSKKVSQYYSNIEIEKGKFINGDLTVGENISDLGGMACILDLANKLKNPNFKELFENYAMIWRETSTEELKEYLLNNDPHAPKKARVNAVLSQFEEFYNTYNIKEEDKMYIKPEERVAIW